MGVSLTIVFTGLCALVADLDRSPGQMLLVDGPGLGKVGDIDLPDHAPTLVARLGSLTNAESASPTSVVIVGSEQVGLWDLRGSEVRVRLQGREGEGLEISQPSKHSSWPAPPADVDDPGGWRDPRFIADMGTLAGDGRIASRFVAGPSGSLPRGVASRFHLDKGRVEAGLPSYEMFRGDVFEFSGADITLRQALTDSIRWTLEGPATAVVEIIPMSGGPIKRLVMAPGAVGHNLFVSNLPAQSEGTQAHHGNDEGTFAAHFAAYYELLQNDPVQKPLPRRSLGTTKGAGGIGPAFCPPARFRRR